MWDEVHTQKFVCKNLLYDNKSFYGYSVVMLTGMDRERERGWRERGGNKANKGSGLVRGVGGAS